MSGKLGSIGNIAGIVTVTVVIIGAIAGAMAIPDDATFDLRLVRWPIMVLAVALLVAQFFLPKTKEASLSRTTVFLSVLGLLSLTQLVPALSRPDADALDAIQFGMIVLFFSMIAIANFLQARKSGSGNAPGTGTSA